MKALPGISALVISLFLVQACKKEKPTPPVASTQSVTEISYTTATSGGEATEEGGAAITSKGICWSTTHSPTIANNKTSNGNGLGAFSARMTQLTSKTLYYVRAYATNSAGTGYGDEVSFTTMEIILPELTTVDITSVTQNSAISGGNITNDNGGAITEKGICWSLTENPTTSDNKTSDGSGTGNFASTITGLAVNTTYYVRAYATNSAGTGYGPQVSFKTAPGPPGLNTSQVSEISAAAAKGGGNITTNGGSDITEYGLVWGTSLNPTISDNQVAISGTTSGAYTCNMQNLTANTVYHVRAYATNSVGTTYGQDIAFTTDPLNVTDVDGNVYNLIRIGNQLWMKENLKTTRYNNGDIIGTTATPLTDVTGESSPKYQWAYDGNESNVEINGRLYTWYAATDPRGACPTGWHVPTDTEWTTLTDYLANNGYGYEGGGNDIAKSMSSTTGWMVYGDPGTPGNNPSSNNSSGFTGVPSGERITYLNTGVIVVEFTGLTTNCAWWTTGELDGLLAYQRILEVVNPMVQKTYYGTKKTGASIRCLRNN